MVVVKLKCKGRQQENEKGEPQFTVDGYPIIEPDLPHHVYKWRICRYNEQTNEFEVITELEDENEAQKLLDYIDDDFISKLEKGINKIKLIKQSTKQTVKKT